MTKIDAIFILLREARTERGSTTAAKRIVRAAKVLELEHAEMIRLLGYFDYCDAEGTPHSQNVERVWA